MKRTTASEIGCGMLGFDGRRRRFAGRLIFGILFGLAAILLAFETAHATNVAVFLSGSISEVDDPYNILYGAVRPGDLLLSSYIFDDAMPDLDARPEAGYYRWTVNELIANPLAVTVDLPVLDAHVQVRGVDLEEYDIAVENDSGAPPADSYRAHAYFYLHGGSSTNVPAMQYGFIVYTWDLMLADSTGQAIDTAGLSSDVAMQGWESACLQLRGTGYMEEEPGYGGLWTITADLTYAGPVQPVPEPMTLLLLGSGLLALAGFRGRFKREAAAANFRQCSLV